MLDMVRDLLVHKADADIMMLNAIQQNSAAAADTQILDLLHHVLLANRFWLQTAMQRPFVLEEESRPFASFDDAIHRYSVTQQQEAAWLERAADADLMRELQDDRIPGGRCSVAHAFMQVCLHSQGHRAQTAKLLRAHGTVPPTTDFILWLSTRSASDGR